MREPARIKRRQGPQELDLPLEQRTSSSLSSPTPHEKYKCLSTHRSHVLIVSQGTWGHCTLPCLSIELRIAEHGC